MKIANFEETQTDNVHIQELINKVSQRTSLRSRLKGQLAQLHTKNFPPTCFHCPVAV